MIFGYHAGVHGGDVHREPRERVAPRGEAPEELRPIALLIDRVYQNARVEQEDGHGQGAHDFAKTLFVLLAELPEPPSFVLKL